MEKAPAFQFYPKDFLEGTAEMSNAETGAYIKLLCHQWLKDGLKNDDKILTRFCNGDSEGLEVAKEKFKLQEDGSLKNERLEKTKLEQEEFRKTQSEKGKAGAAKRWPKNSSGYNPAIGSATTPATIRPIPKDSSASSSSSAINSSLSRDEILRIMRSNTNRKKYSDKLIENEVDVFIEKYKNSKIANLTSLVNSWATNLKPDIQEKTMVL